MRKVDFNYDIEKHEKFFYSQLSECGKRQCAGLESMKLGYNGVAIISRKYGIDRHTVRKGKEKLDSHWNAALTTINLAKIQHRKEQFFWMKNFSMANSKTLYNNVLLLD